MTYLDSLCRNRPWQPLAGRVRGVRKGCWSERPESLNLNEAFVCRGGGLWPEEALIQEGFQVRVVVRAPAWHGEEVVHGRAAAAGVHCREVLRDGVVFGTLAVIAQVSPSAPAEERHEVHIDLLETLLVDDSGQTNTHSAQTSHRDGK